MSLQRTAVLASAVLAACATHATPPASLAPAANADSYDFVARVTGVGIIAGRISLDSGRVAFRSNSPSGLICGASLDVDADGRLHAACGGIALTVARSAEGLARSGRIAVTISATAETPAPSLDCRQSFGVANPLQAVACAKSSQQDARTQTFFGRVELRRADPALPKPARALNSTLSSASKTALD